jgi:beta-galactosidase
LVSLPKGSVRLDILVENMGRINFGPYLLKNKKGITEMVMLDGRELNNWKMYGLPFNKVEDLPQHAVINDPAVPVIKQGTFILDSVADTYLDMRKWGKGIVWINGHNLGRYWKVGPQQSLYVPGEWLKKGANKITIFELLDGKQKSISTVKSPILDELNGPDVTK